MKTITSSVHTAQTKSIARLLTELATLAKHATVLKQHTYYLLTMTTLTQLLKISQSRWVDADWSAPKNACIDDIIERFDDCPEALVDFQRSDWVNMAECYTYQSLERWNKHEEDIKALWDAYCEAIGATSTMQALEGVCDGFDDGDDMNAAIVNLAMSWGALDLLADIARHASDHPELGGELWQTFRDHY